VNVNHAGSGSGEIVERCTILRAVVGSTVHGLHHGAQDDRDEMAVFIEPPEYLIGHARARGLRGGLYGFEHYVERSQPEGTRSGPGDLDLVAYSLRKYVRLALKGHPTILLLLFVPDDLVLARTELGDELRALRPSLLSKRAGRGYLGYLRGQKERLLAIRWQKRVNRPELVESHGFDTKYAMHAARLGYQGIELLETGNLTLPMPEPERSRVMAIRKGGVHTCGSRCRDRGRRGSARPCAGEQFASRNARSVGDRSVSRGCVPAGLGLVNRTAGIGSRRAGPHARLIREGVGGYRAVASHDATAGV